MVTGTEYLMPGTGTATGTVAVAVAIEHAGERPEVVWIRHVVIALRGECRRQRLLCATGRSDRVQCGRGQGRKRVRGAFVSPRIESRREMWALLLVLVLLVSGEMTLTTVLRCFQCGRGQRREVGRGGVRTVWTLTAYARCRCRPRGARTAATWCRGDVRRVAGCRHGFGRSLQLSLLVLQEGELFLEVALLDLQSLERRGREMMLGVEGYLMWVARGKMGRGHRRGVGRAVLVLRQCRGKQGNGG